MAEPGTPPNSHRHYALAEWRVFSPVPVGELFSLANIMKCSCSAAFLAALTVSLPYPNQKISQDGAVHFGQEQAEVERLLNKKASPDTSVIARPGKDFVLKLQGTTLHFDSGRLNDLTFDADFDFAAPIAAFREPWQNLDVIGELRIAKGMRKPAFLNYFAAWEARAKQLGAQRQEGSGLLKAGEYRVEFIQNNFTDMIHVSLGPERSTGRGGTWGSSLSFSFVRFQSSRPPNVRPGTLKSVSVFCDEFNTCAR